MATRHRHLQMIINFLLQNMSESSTLLVLVISIYKWTFRESLNVLKKDTRNRRSKTMQFHLCRVASPASPSSSFSFSCSLIALAFLATNIHVWTTTTALIKLPPNVTIPAVLVFGDSIVDAGNNNDIQTLIKCDFPPYGLDFEGGIPTGRFCDGKIPSDIIGITSLSPLFMH